MKVIRSIIFMVVFILLALCVSYLFGYKVLMLVLSLTFAIMATVFLVNNEAYYKYMKYMNINSYQIMENKSEAFNRKNLKINIFCYYILAVVMLFHAIVGRNDALDFLIASGKDLFYYLIIVVIVGFLSIFTGNKIVESSNSNKEYILMAIGVGIFMSVIIVAGLLWIALAA